MLRLLVLFLAVVALGCASAPSAPYHPPQFVVEAAAADAAWQRAQAWLAMNGASWGVTGIQTTTDVVIQTARPASDTSAEVFVSVTRAKRPDGSWEFRVLAETWNPLSSGRAAKVEQALSRFVGTGA